MATSRQRPDFLLPQGGGCWEVGLYDLRPLKLPSTHSRSRTFPKQWIIDYIIIYIIDGVVHFWRLNYSTVSCLQEQRTAPCVNCDAPKHSKPFPCFKKLQIPNWSQVQHLSFKNEFSRKGFALSHALKQRLGQFVNGLFSFVRLFWFLVSSVIIIVVCRYCWKAN